MKNELKRQTKIFDDKDDRRNANNNLINMLLIIIGLVSLFIFTITR